MYERRSPWSMLVPSAVVVSSVIMSSLYTQAKVEGVERDKADERVERVQQYNAQLMPQILEVSPGVMGTVAIKDQDETFSFAAREDGQTQTCRGEYEVTDEVATVAGPITCTKTTTLLR